MQRDRSNRAFSTVLSFRPLKPRLYTLLSHRLFPHAHLYHRSPSVSPRVLVSFPICLLPFSFLPSSRSCSRARARAEQHDLLIVLLSRSRYHPAPATQPVPFRSSYAVSVSPTFLLFASAFRIRRFLLRPRSHPLYPLGELYPVNRGTLLVTVCNLTKDQTKRDPTYQPPEPHMPLVQETHTCGKAHGRRVLRG